MRVFPPALLPTALLVLLAALPARAGVDELLLYPDGAEVTQSATLDAASGSVSFVLPASADPETLAVAASGGAAVTHVDWQRQSAADSELVAQLKDRIQRAQKEVDASEAALASIEARLGFWQQLAPGKDPDPGRIAALAQDMGKHVDELRRARPEAQRVLNERREELARLEQRLDEITGPNRLPFTVTAGISGASGPVGMTWRYRVSDAGWSSAYRINAQPGRKTVSLDFEAVLRQSLGRDLSAKVSLATLAPVTRLDPPQLPDWVIRPRAKHAEAAPRRAKTDMRAMVMAAPGSNQAPQLTRRATYTVWDLGRITLPAGTNKRVMVSRSELAAEFTHLCRPALSPQAFVRAEASLEKSRILPPGEAVYLLDGAMLAKRPFSLHGKEADIYFGPDPLVSCKEQVLTRQSGESGFLSARNTLAWQWEIEARNERPDAVSLVVEEPMPRLADERIEPEYGFDPEPASRDQSVVWKLDLAGSETRKITWSVRVEAPKDMALDPGWR